MFEYYSSSPNPSCYLCLPSPRRRNGKYVFILQEPPGRDFKHGAFKENKFHYNIMRSSSKIKILISGQTKDIKCHCKIKLAVGRQAARRSRRDQAKRRRRQAACGVRCRPIRWMSYPASVNICWQEFWPEYSPAIGKLPADIGHPESAFLSCQWAEQGMVNYQW
jgi:hypothetical protein